MKILFVCMSNVGRSQMAMSLYNQLTNSSDAESSGTEVYSSGETLQERRDRKGGIFVIDAMAEEGIDVRNNEQTQVTQGMLDNYDKVINMAGEGHTPEWLSSSPNYTAWDIDDPGGKGLEETNIAKEAIKLKIEELIGTKNEPSGC